MTNPHPHKKSIFINSADGPTGHDLALLLSTQEHRGHFEKISAGLCDESRGEELRKRGINVVKYKPDDEQDLERHYKGHDVVYVIPPHHSNDPFQAAQRMIKVCERMKVKGALLLSVINAEKSQEEVMKEFVELEEEFRKCKDISCRVIMRTGFYMQRFLLYRDQIAEENVLPLYVGDGKFAPISVHDVSYFTCCVLGEKHHKDQEHHGKTYNLTGLQMITGEQVARKASQALGIELKFKDITREEAEQLLRDREDLDEKEVEAFLAIYEMVKNKHLEVMTEDFEKITKRKPMTVEEWFREHRDQFAPRK